MECVQRPLPFVRLELSCPVKVRQNLQLEATHTTYDLLSRRRYRGQTHSAPAIPEKLPSGPYLSCLSLRLKISILTVLYHMLSLLEIGRFAV